VTSIMAKASKELTGDVSSGVATQILMFDSWRTDSGLDALSTENKAFFIQHQLQFSGLTGTQAEVDIVKLEITRQGAQFSPDLFRAFREQTDFDNSVPVLCELLRLPTSFYTR
jgi:hypothetical protein